MANYSWAGTWSSNTYYEINTFVKHENIAYVSTNSVQGSNPPPLDMLNWNVFVIGYQTPITPTPTSTISTTPTATPTPTVTETPTPTPTVTVTPTETETPTPTPTPTITVTPTETETPTPTPTITQTPTVTPTELVLINPILAGVDEYIVVGNDEYLMFVDPVSPTPTPTPTVTETPTPTPTSTETPTPTPTSTETPTPTQTSTETPTPTVTPSSVLGSLFEMVLFESGSDVIMSGTGQFNLTDLVYRQAGNFTGFIIPNTASLSSGTNNLTPTPVDLYTGSTLTFPPNFGVSGITNANSGSGNMVSVIKQGSTYNLVVPSGYTSNTTLITQSTFTGKTLSSLGVTVGTYNYTWGSGVNAGTLKLTIG